MKTYSLKSSEISRRWYLLDASQLPLGRLSTTAARLLIGKDKPSLTPHMDNGDFVVIINADQLVVTGGKVEKKIYYRHSGYPGGIYQRTLKEMQARDSTAIIRKSVRGMLPVNKLRPDRLRRLKIFPGADHQHTAQQPEHIDLTPRSKR